MVFDEVYDDVKEKFQRSRNSRFRLQPPVDLQKGIKKGFFKSYEFVYDEYYDCVVCPNNKVLKYMTTNRDGYKEFNSNPSDCEKCTNSKNHQKIVTKHIWSDYIELAEDIRHSQHGKEIYALQSQTIERVFADAKEKHAMRYTFIKSLLRVQNWFRLKFTAMNLKSRQCGHRIPALFLKYPHRYTKNPCFLLRMLGFFDRLGIGYNPMHFLIIQKNRHLLRYNPYNVSVFKIF